MGMHLDFHDGVQAAPETASPPRRVSTGTKIVVALLVFVLVYFAGKVLLLAVAGVLVGIFLHSAASFCARWTRLSHGPALMIVMLLLGALLALAVWRVERRVFAQADELTTTLKESADEARSYLENFRWGRTALQEFSNGSGMLAAPSAALTRARDVVGGVAGFAAQMLVILFIGVYCAAEPDLYKDGIARLVPSRNRERVERLLDELSDTLQWWILGKLCSMAIVGLLVGIGLSLLGVKAALLLALVAAFMELIPNFGPLLAAIPAVISGLMDGPTTAVYVLVLYVIVQALESYVILPLIQRRAVDAPPALMLISIVLLGLLGGILGALVATPLLVATMVIVKRLYLAPKEPDIAST